MTTSLILFMSVVGLIETGDGRMTGYNYTVGDGGAAVGALQIHACCVEDVNRFGGSKAFVYPDDCFSIAKSRTIAVVYLSHYGESLASLEGRELTPEDYGRLWNGGPAPSDPGKRLLWKSRTDGYARKVRSFIENQKRNGGKPKRTTKKGK